MTELVEQWLRGKGRWAPGRPSTCIIMLDWMKTWKAYWLSIYTVEQKNGIIRRPQKKWRDMTGNCGQQPVKQPLCITHQQRISDQVCIMYLTQHICLMSCWRNATNCAGWNMMIKPGSKSKSGKINRLWKELAKTQICSNKSLGKLVRNSAWIIA